MVGGAVDCDGLFPGRHLLERAEVSHQRVAGDGCLVLVRRGESFREVVG